MSYLDGGPARNGTIQTLAYTVASSSSSSAFGAQTYAVKLIATSACVYKIGNGSQTAVDDNTGVFLPASWVEIVQVTPGQSIAGIRKASNGLITATDGTLWVVELTN